MSPAALELVDLVARWIHAIAGIMWIGNSLLFNWLDRRLLPAGPRRLTPEPLGSAWLLHSGGFYYVEKTLLGGAGLPAPLNWFKWQAYTTWWSGLVLLLAVYWFGGRAVLADPAVAALSPAQAVATGAGAILGGWLLYETMQRLVAPRAPRFAATVWIGGLAVLSVALLQLLSGRAAFVHIGAMLGTIMAGNVVFTIVPSQRELVAAVAGGEGRGGDPAVSARAKRVSLHNNYFTFPVIALMLSGHFPALYSQERSWLVLLVLAAGGMLVRHLLNLRFTWRAWRPALGAALLGTVAALYGLLRTGSPPAGAASAAPDGPVSFSEVRHIIDRRCAPCHSATPSDSSYGIVPGGVHYDTPEQIAAYAVRIRERAVLTRTMPPANKTGMSEAERGVLARWIAEGARLR
jgi:uncharacterized membrane protein